MTDRIDGMEERLRALAEKVAGLEERLHALERTPISKIEPELDNDADFAHEESMTAGDATAFAQRMAELGVTFLVLAGAFLLRAMTDMRVLPQGLGIACGLIYALVWIGFAHRASARDRVGRANFFGIAGALIAYPLIWEAATNFGVLSTVPATGILALVTGIALGITRQGRLRLLSWVFSLAAVVTSIALIFAMGEMEWLIVLLLALGLASVWLAYDRQWFGLRWPVALAVDLAVLQMVVMASSPEGPPDHYAGLSVAAAKGLALSLLVVYPGSFIFRALSRMRNVTAFEILQTGGALAIGFGGAVKIAENAGSGEGVLGAVALLAALASYLVSFIFVDRRLGKGVNFFYFTTLAIVLMILGTALLSGGALLAFLWSLFALAAAYLGGRHDRVTLRVHCAVYALLASQQAGLLGQAWAAFTQAADASWMSIDPVALVVLAGSVTAYVLLVMTQRSRSSGDAERIPRFVMAALSLLGISSIVVILANRVATGWGAVAHPALLAAIRTGVLSFSAILLAVVGRNRQLRELSWLVYPLLAAGGLKLVLEDLRSGNAAALTAGFICFGLALIAAPRLLRGGD